MQKSIIITLIILAIFSCKKKDDTSFPVINILSPNSNQQYNFGDIINVSADIDDDKNIEFVTISLLDESQKSIGNSMNINPDIKEYSLSKQLTIDNTGIVTGAHYIQISASDGTNITKEFVKIYIQEQLLEQEGIYVFSNNNNICKVYLLENNQSLQFEFNHTYSVLDAIVNSHTQQLSILSNSGNLTTYNISNYNIAWTEDNINDFQTSFNGSLKIYDNLTFVSYRTGHIKAFDDNGVVRQTAEISETQHYPTKFFKHYEHLIAALETNYTLSNKIEKIYYSTGVPINNYDIDFTVTAMFSYNNDKAIIWGNKNNVAKVCTLSVLNNVIYELPSMPQGKLYSVEQINTNTFLLCIDNDIYTFSVGSDVFTTYKTGERADIIKYNEFSGNLYFADSNIIRIYNYSANTLIKEIVHTDKINDIEFWFNK